MSEGGKDGYGVVAVQESPEARLARLEARVAALERVRPEGPVPMVPLDQAVLEFGNHASIIREPSFVERYKDRSVVIVCPTRGMIACDVVTAIRSIVTPMNQRWNGPMFARGFEVAKAYNALVDGILEHKFLSTWKYLLCVEDDNLPPFDGLLRLIETAEVGPNFDGSSEWDGVGGLYFTKDSVHSPLLFGDADEFARTGYANYYPVDLSKVEPCPSFPCEDVFCRKHVLPCNGLAMGFTLYKIDLFKRMRAGGVREFFQTVNDKILVEGELVKPVDADGMVELEPGKGYKRLVTQDLAFSDLAITKYGARFCGDLRVRVGHLDVASGRVY